ncbi:hypothetical protein [Stappia sp.]|uniref:hypothetical protein n=1 Tax=Stappia sp. TaxID=1870903 RepID=UPI003C7D6A4C
MKMFLVTAALALTTTCALAQESLPQTLITNVHVFDEVNEARIENASVLIEGNLISAVSTDPIEADGATVIDGADAR